MKKSRLIGMCALLLLTAMPVTAQQIIYGSAKALAGGKGDTVTTLHVERRTRNQLYLMGGADYRIESSTNQSLSRYLRKRCYAVRIDSTLYVNCRKMRYKRYRLGGWYASALEIGGHIFYAAQPVGQAATETLHRDTDSARCPQTARRGGRRHPGIGTGEPARLLRAGSGDGTFCFRGQGTDARTAGGATGTAEGVRERNQRSGGSDGEIPAVAEVNPDSTIDA